MEIRPDVWVVTEFFENALHFLSICNHIEVSYYGNGNAKYAIKPTSVGNSPRPTDGGKMNVKVQVTTNLFPSSLIDSSVTISFHNGDRLRENPVKNGFSSDRRFLHGLRKNIGVDLPSMESTRRFRQPYNL